MNNKNSIYLIKEQQMRFGKLINADVNGSLNIMRKVVGDSEIISKIINSGWLFQPLRVNIL